MQLTRHPDWQFTTIPALLCCLLLTLSGGCAVHIPTATEWSELETEQQRPDTQLLDVGVVQFIPPEDTGDAVAADEATIGRAEARYMPVMLQYSLQQSGNWGSVNVLPQIDASWDVNVTGRILESSPHTLRLEITVTDASGREWYSQRYSEYVGDNVYGDTSLGVNDPFQGLYNRIANDLAAYLETQLSPADTSQIRQLSALQFGRQFLPAHYARFVETNRRGVSSVKGLPAGDDPINALMAGARIRDRAFHEVLQQHYFDYARELAVPYFQYRRAGFRELRDLHEQQTEARNQMLAGALWVGIGVATADVDSLLSTTASTAMILKGGSDLLAGMSTFPEESEFMAEITESFANDESVETIDLDDRVVILSGSVEEIYGEWRRILGDMLVEEAGS
jgi:hypothetical protein